MKLYSLLVAMLIGISAAGPLAAQDMQTPLDTRIRVIDYDADRITRLTGHTGYQMVVEFGVGEKVETVAVGDSSGWQITPNAAANLLFVKPMGLVAPTNMTIVTSKRRYNFELVTRSGVRAPRGEIIYALRFRYPAEPTTEILSEPPPPLITSSPDTWNRAYSYDGAASNIPDEIFDDGASTYLRFSKDASSPAIFIVTADAGESLVNFAVRGPYVVIEQVAQQFILRQGKNVTRIFNDGFQNPVPGPDAPTLRVKTKRGKSDTSARMDPK